MNKVFYFGEKMDEYDVRVLNEREVRASAGILFFFAMIAFMNAWLTGNFYPTKIFVIAFLIDFTVRIFVNPKYSPSMILGRFSVRNQKEEFVGAPQKKFAWSIGFVLALAMLFLVVINNVIGPINLLICSICLVLLFFESAFGICIGCNIYNLVHKEKAILCPGGACEPIHNKEAQKVSLAQTVVMVLFLIAMASVWNVVAIKSHGNDSVQENQKNIGKQHQNAATIDDCKVPDWASSIGHAEKWKLHHNCK